MRPRALLGECSTRSQVSLSSRCFLSTHQLCRGFLPADVLRFRRCTVPRIILLRQFLLGHLLDCCHFANGRSLRLHPLLLRFLFRMHSRSLPPAPVRLLSILLPVQRSEEHTSELQSPMYLVCRLLLEKKKTHK